jgi:hypothetical protein
MLKCGVGLAAGCTQRRIDPGGDEEAGSSVQTGLGSAGVGDCSSADQQVLVGGQLADQGDRAGDRHGDFEDADASGAEPFHGGGGVGGGAGPDHRDDPSGTQSVDQGELWHVRASFARSDAGREAQGQGLRVS